MGRFNPICIVLLASLAVSALVASMPGAGPAEAEIQASDEGHFYVLANPANTV